MTRITTYLLLLTLLPLTVVGGNFFDIDHLQCGVFINKLYIDNNGFLWAATSNGIIQYDGYKFQVFKQGQKNSQGLGNNHVLSMAQGRNGLLYFGFYGHLQSYDGVRFSDVKKYDRNGSLLYCGINCLLERRNGDLVAGTSNDGMLLIVNTDSTAHEYGIDLKGAKSIRSLAEDNAGRLWIVSENGVFCYNGQTVKQYMDDGSQIQYYSICADNAGNVFVGTANRGLFRLEGESFVHVDATGNAPIPSLCCGHDGNILVGFDGKGIAIYNPIDGSLTANPLHSHEVELSKSKVYSIVEDNSGNIWLGLCEKGIFQQSMSASGFKYMGYRAGADNVIGTSNVCCVFVDSHHNTWVGTDKDGIYQIDRSNRLVQHYSDGVPSTVLTIAEDNDGRIWIGSYGDGGGWIDPKTMRYHDFGHKEPDFATLTDYVVDRYGRIWAGTMGHGLLMWKAQDQRQISQYRKEDDLNRHLTHNFIPQLTLSDDGKRLYVCTLGGLNSLDLDSLTWNGFFGGNSLMPDANVYVACENGGIIWLGTNEGLLKYDIASRQIVSYNIENGLSSNYITSLQPDSLNQLWIGTDCGLSCMDINNEKFVNYYVDDGLQSNYFTNGASFAMPDGQLLFGGMGGITWYNPCEIVLRQWQAQVSITAFTINGEPVDHTTMSGGYHVTDSIVALSQQFELDYRDNSFAVSFSTLTYDDPQRITYFYSINNEKFVSLQQGNNEITFSHLAPGRYRFRVKASYKGIETTERIFTVIVHAPWYRTWWAFLLYAALLAVVAWRYMLLRRRRETEQKIMQEHIQAEQLSESKLKFFINLSHDIRTPMTLIVTPLLTLIKHEDNPQRKGIYEIMRRNAERILGLINQMMDLRKIDKGLMQMRMQETDIIGFVQDLYMLFEHQARSRQISFVYNHDIDKLPVWIDRRYFDKVVVNVLSNAFKFTPTGGEIAINLTHSSQNVDIAIRDNGEKIPEDKLERIFERFYQSDSDTNAKNTGTGIGLDLARSLVELHYGTISAHNLDKGCEFVISLPLGCSHLTPAEMVKEGDSDENDDVQLAVAETMSATEDGEPVEIPAEHPDRQRPLLIIAEDDDEIRNFLAAELANEYEVKAFADGRQAFAEIVRMVPDLVLSDVMMPEMDGNTLCMNLRANLATSHVPIVLLTAMSMDEDRLKGLTIGADAYIVKPFNMDILRQTIVNLIQRTRALRLKYEHTDHIEGQTPAKSITSPDQKLLANIMETINNHLDDDNLTIDLIASEVGLSRVHLHRKMKDLTGQTPHDFIRKVRLKKAAELLAEGKMNVSQVTYTCGFSSTTSFSALFKKFYGVSPSQYGKK